MAFVHGLADTCVSQTAENESSLPILHKCRGHFDLQRNPDDQLLKD